MEFNAKNLYDIAMKAREEMRERLADDIDENFNNAIDEIMNAATDGNTSTIFTIDCWNDYTEGELACIKTEVSKLLRTAGLFTYKCECDEDMLVKWGREAQKFSKYATE